PPVSLDNESAEHTARIANGLLELGPDKIVSTTLYNGQFPGPLLRFKEGRQTTVDIHNDTDTPEQLHWHGQFVPDSVDGGARLRDSYLGPHPTGCNKAVCRCALF